MKDTHKLLLLLTLLLIGIAIIYVDRNPDKFPEKEIIEQDDTITKVNEPEYYSLDMPSETFSDCNTGIGRIAGGTESIRIIPKDTIVIPSCSDTIFWIEALPIHYKYLKVKIVGAKDGYGGYYEFHNRKDSTVHKGRFKL
ncbi:MAG TPA: hypothetical protein VMW32_06185 [Bacteroidales bacterium]|nr:hypothetical protein [Bacteroidales bacterium]